MNALIFGIKAVGMVFLFFSACVALSLICSWVGDAVQEYFSK